MVTVLEFSDKPRSGYFLPLQKQDGKERNLAQEFDNEKRKKKLKETKL
jgi:hypothetical protein